MSEGVCACALVPVSSMNSRRAVSSTPPTSYVSLLPPKSDHPTTLFLCSLPNNTLCVIGVGDVGDVGVDTGDVEVFCILEDMEDMALWIQYGRIPADLYPARIDGGRVV